MLMVKIIKYEFPQMWASGRFLHKPTRASRAVEVGRGPSDNHLVDLLASKNDKCIYIFLIDYKLVRP